MTDQQTLRHSELCDKARDFWEQRYAALAGGDFPWDIGADVDTKRWWSRFGEGFPLPTWLEKPNVAGNLPLKAAGRKGSG